MSKLETDLAIQLMAEKIPFEREVSGLIPGRKFRVDFLIPPNLVVEVEGGNFSNGRHTRGVGFENDCEKYNILTILGYAIIRVTSNHIKDGRALKWVEDYISKKH